MRSQRFSSEVLVRCTVALRRFFQKGWSVMVLLVVKFRGQCVLIQQDEQSEEPERCWQDEAESPLLSQ